jgi:hypothetical protein
VELQGTRTYGLEALLYSNSRGMAWCASSGIGDTTSLNITFSISCADQGWDWVWWASMTRYLGIHHIIVFSSSGSSLRSFSGQMIEMRRYHWTVLSFWMGLGDM